MCEFWAGFAVTEVVLSNYRRKVLQNKRKVINDENKTLRNFGRTVRLSVRGVRLSFVTKFFKLRRDCSSRSPPLRTRAIYARSLNFMRRVLDFYYRNCCASAKAIFQE